MSDFGRWIYTRKITVCSIIEEIYRICGKQVLIAVHFSIPYHPDLYDFYRLTHQALERKIHEAGFEQVEIFPYGKGMFTLALYHIQRVLG